MLPLKLFIAGLVASAVGMALFALTLVGLNTQVNVLDLALHNPSTPTNSANLPLNSVDNLKLGEDVTGTITGTVTNTLTVSGTNKIIDAITQYFSGTLTNTATISDIVGLRNDGWGYGEIFRLYELAKESGQSPNDIKAMRDSGMGWGQIAMDLGLSPGNKGNNLGAAVSGRGVISETQSTASPSVGNGNSHGNPHGDPPGKSGGGGPPPGRGNGKGK